MKKVYFSLLLAAFHMSVYCQETLWQKDIRSENQDFLSSLCQTPDRQLLLSGSTIRKGAAEDLGGQSASRGYDYHIVKLDQNGNEVWEKYFGGSQHDFLSSAAASQDGGFLLVGTSYSGVSADKKEGSYGGSDIWVIKTDENGQEQWQRTFGTESGEEGGSAAQSTDLGFFVAGSISSAKGGFGAKDGWVVKLDKKGREVSETILGGRSNDEIEKIIPTRDGGVLVTLYSRSGETPEIEVATKKISSQGPAVAGQRSIEAVIPVNYVAKQAENNGEGDYWVVKLDKAGRHQWQKSYGGKGDDHIRTVGLTDNGYILAGESNSPASGSKAGNTAEGSDVWIINLDGSGNELWQKTYSFGKRDVLMSLQTIRDKDHHVKGYLLGGFTQAEGTATRDEEKFWMMYLDAEGQEVWRKTVEGKTAKKQERLVSAEMTGGGGYVLAGTATDELGSENWKVVMLGDKDVEQLVEKKAISVYPNPVQDYCYVEIGEPFKEAQITLYDMAGRLIYNQKTKTPVTKINTSPLPQGVYIVNATTETQKLNAKIIKQ